MNAIPAYPKPTRYLLEDWLDARKAERERRKQAASVRNKLAAKKRKRR